MVCYESQKFESCEDQPVTSPSKKLGLKKKKIIVPCLLPFQISSLLREMSFHIYPHPAPHSSKFWIDECLRCEVFREFPGTLSHLSFASIGTALPMLSHSPAASCRWGPTSDPALYTHSSQSVWSPTLGNKPLLNE